MKIKSLGLEDVRSVEWNYNTQALQLVDQRLIPFRISFVQLSSVKEICSAIKEMVVRGAPAIGATAAFGIVQAIKEIENESSNNKKKMLDEKLKQLLKTRPTAVDLKNFASKTYEIAVGSNFSMKVTLERAQELADRMVDECKLIGKKGAELIQDGDTILTHCNAGPMATIDVGTALAPLFEANREGKNISVIVDETRPRLQGAKITAWELEQEDIEHKIIPDSAAAFLMSKGKINRVILGADRCLKDGTISNKIGTLSVAISAKYYDIPFYSAFPWSTIDFQSESSDDFDIEFRDEKEIKYVTSFEEEMLIANPTSNALNPAFDITPPNLITGYITSRGVLNRENLNKEILKETK